MPSKAGRGKTANHAKGQAKSSKTGAGWGAESPVKAGGKPDTIVRPIGRISRRAAVRVRAGHPWVYKSDVEEMIVHSGGESVAAGSLVEVIDERGRALGTAMYSNA